MEPDAHHKLAPVQAKAVLVFGILCVSSAAIFVKLAEPEAEPLAIATWRLVFSSAILLPTVLLTRRPALRRLDASDSQVVLFAGLALAVHFALWITSLRLTSVASSVVLVTTNPLWVALAEPVLFRQRYRPLLLAGVAVAFLGGVIIALGDRSVQANALAGDVLAVGGAIAAAAYFLAGRSVRARMDLLVYVALVYSVAAVALLATSLARGVPLAPFSAYTWLMLVLLAVVPQVLGHSSFNWALGHLSATYVSATVLGEALGSTLLAWWVLGQQPPPTTVTGGALILLGLWLASRAENRWAPMGPS
jgi:drug/metabolite transporter (DMT)-like permease